MDGAITQHEQFKTSQLRTLLTEATADVDRLQKELDAETERYGTDRDSGTWGSVETIRGNRDRAVAAKQGLESTLARHEAKQADPAHVALLAECDRLQVEAETSNFPEQFSRLAPKIEAACNALLDLIPEATKAVQTAAQPSVDLQLALERAGLRGLIQFTPIDQTQGLGAFRTVLQQCINRSQVPNHQIRAIGIKP